jgi:hypothetical protein
MEGEKEAEDGEERRTVGHGAGVGRAEAVRGALEDAVGDQDVSAQIEGRPDHGGADGREVDGPARLRLAAVEERLLEGARPCGFWAWKCAYSLVKSRSRSKTAERRCEKYSISSAPRIFVETRARVTTLAIRKATTCSGSRHRSQELFDAFGPPRPRVLRGLLEGGAGKRHLQSRGRTRRARGRRPRPRRCPAAPRCRCLPSSTISREASVSEIKSGRPAAMASKALIGEVCSEVMALFRNGATTTVACASSEATSFCGSEPLKMIRSPRLRLLARS